MTEEIINPKKVSPSTLEALSELQESLPAYVIKPSLGMQYGMENKYVTWKFSDDRFANIELLHITDIQFGHVECQENRVIEYRDWVLSKPNRFVFFGGDMIDAATVLSPGDHPWDNICGPQGQVYKFCKLMAPLRPRILGYVGGNHERRTRKTFGDSGLLISYLLRIPYSSGQQLIDVYFGKHKPFPVHLWHGMGSSQTKGAKVMMAKHFADRYPGSRLYLVGHLHDCFLLPEIIWERVPDKNNVKMLKRFIGMSSSFLNFWGTYAEVAGLAANDVLMIRTILEPNGGAEATIR